MRDRWRDVPLARRLVVAFVGLLSVGLAIGTLAMMIVLQFRLMAQADGDLHTVAERIDRTSLAEVRSQARNLSSYRDDLFIAVQDLNGNILNEIAPGEDNVDDPRPRIDNLDLTNAGPMTVSGDSGGISWRVLHLQLLNINGEHVGYLTIALSLKGMDETLSTFLSHVMLVDIAIVILGGLLALFLVKTSLRPLREIEETAGAIAAGDLSRRIPDGPTTTEAGSLAHSLNVMLTHIERSFEAQRASEERMRRFVSDASHELRTPLATVRGYGELYRLGGIPDEELPGSMQRIESEATRMSGLVNDLLELARLDEGRVLDAVSVDLTALAADAVSDMKALDPDRPATLVALDGSEPSPVFAVVDENKVRQVFANLTGNAVQHTPPGTPVEVAVGTEGECAVVEVRDHGPGVPDGDTSRIFGRFYRVDTSRSRFSGGTGLGLAIVAAIAEVHRGRVRAANTDGGGLTIRLEVPLRPAESE